MRDSAGGQLELVLLATLRGCPRHGYAIVEEIRRRSNGTFDLPEGSVYPELHKMEKQGLIKSHWTEHNGRRRRNYQLTRSGGYRLRERQKAWDQLAKAMRKVLEPTV